MRLSFFHIFFSFICYWLIIHQSFVNWNLCAFCPFTDPWTPVMLCTILSVSLGHAAVMEAPGMQLQGRFDIYQHFACLLHHFGPGINSQNTLVWYWEWAEFFKRDVFPLRAEGPIFRGNPPPWPCSSCLLQLSLSLVWCYSITKLLLSLQPAPGSCWNPWITLCLHLFWSTTLVTLPRRKLAGKVVFRWMAPATNSSHGCKDRFGGESLGNSRKKSQPCYGSAAWQLLTKLLPASFSLQPRSEASRLPFHTDQGALCVLFSPPAISLLSCTLPEFEFPQGPCASPGCPVPTVLPPPGAVITPAAFTFVCLKSSLFAISNESAKCWRAIVFWEHHGRL